MTPLAVPSFAKINWFLQILGKRPDGYHQLRTIYQTIDLADEIVFETLDTPDVLVETMGREVARGERNLVYRAAQLLRRVAGAGQGVRIRLKKHIPVGSGLGGGSSNAAMTLLALNQLWDCRLKSLRLLELAGRLGSDVPFFLVGGTALGTGRGEKISPLPELPKRYSLMILYPAFELSSKEAYSARDWGTFGGEDILTASDLDTTIHDLRQALEQVDGWSSPGNDFEGPLLEQHPGVADVRRHLGDLGYQRVRLSGSGSAMFALDPLERAEESVRERGFQGEIFFSQTLSRQEYHSNLKQSGLDLTNIY